MSTPRRADIDRAKGLAILLVVFGHLVAREDPRGVDWYEPIRHAVYLFHMPFFFYLSGMVAFLAGGVRLRRGQFAGLARRRTQRLLVPFALFGLAIVLAKPVLALLIPVDNVPPAIGAGLLALVWDTARSPALSVWYLAALFAYSLAVPLLVRADGGRLRIAAAAAALLFVVPAPPIAYLDRIAGYAVFFMAGVIAAEAGGAWLRALDRFSHAWIAAFAAVLALAATRPIAAEAYRWWLLACGLLSMPALHALVRARVLDRSQWLLILGRYTLVVYLLNTIFIGLTKGVLLTFAPWDGDNFMAFAAVLMLAGVAGPILMKREMFWRLPALDRMTD